MEIRFDGKRALVTGAGKGIGRGIARALYAGGAETFALSRTQQDLDSLKEELPNLHTVCVDLTDWGATRKAVEEISPIDLLVNNAGNYIKQSFFEISPDSFDSMVELNVKAVLNVSQVVAKCLIKEKRSGSIVNVSSIRSTQASNQSLVYGMSKAALNQITRTMALELGPHQIRVNAVKPGLTMTPSTCKFGYDDPVLLQARVNRTPLGRVAEVEDIVAPVLFLLSDKASMIHGALIPVDGGISVT